MPLMLDQSGQRYATIFTSEKAVSQFQQACCSIGDYQPQALASSEEIRTTLQTTRKVGCSFLLTDPQGPEIDQRQAQPLAAFMRELDGSSAAKD